MTLFGAVGMLGMLCGGLYLYFTAVGKVQSIESGVLVVDEAEERMLRLQLVPLAVFQSMLGLSVAVVLGSSGDTAGKLNGSSEWGPGLAVYISMLVAFGGVALAAYFFTANRRAQSTQGDVELPTGEGGEGGEGAQARARARDHGSAVPTPFVPDAEVVGRWATSSNRSVYASS